MQQDRFLTGILIGIVLLVLVALGAFFWRQHAPPPFAEDSPQGVVLRFMQAVDEHRYRDAYDLLAQDEDTPSYSDFRRAMMYQADALDEVSVEIGESEIHGDEAWVQLWVSWISAAPFAEPSRNAGQALLERQEGGWCIVEMPYPYGMWKYPD